MVSYADTAQVGAIGAQASASVGLTTSMMWLVNAPLFAFGMGVLSVISRALGSGDRETARKAGVQAIWLTVFLGVGLGIVTVAIAPFLPAWLGGRYGDTARCLPILWGGIAADAVSEQQHFDGFGAACNGQYAHAHDL